MDMYIYYYYALRATATYTHHYQVLQEKVNIQLNSPAEGYNPRTTYTTKTKFLHKILVYPRKMPITGYCLKTTFGEAREDHTWCSPVLGS